MTATESLAPSAAVPSMGASLRSLRESQGLSPEEVSSRIKFSARQIRALEEERWDDLPTGVSLRGLVRNYARLLGADDVSLVASVAPAPAQTIRPVDDVGARTTRASMPTRVPVSSEDGGGGMSWGWLLILVLFIAAALAYAFWQGWLPQHWLPAGWL